MAQIGGTILLENYGGPLEVAKAYIRGEIDTLQDCVRHVCSLVDIAAAEAAIRLESESVILPQEEKTGPGLVLDRNGRPFTVHSVLMHSRSGTGIPTYIPVVVYPRCITIDMHSNKWSLGGTTEDGQVAYLNGITGERHAHLWKIADSLDEFTRDQVPATGAS